MIKIIIPFKSDPGNYQKELTGIKPCTIRKKDLEDDRHLSLGAMMVSQDYGIIEIHNNITKRSFRRQITDVTDYEGWLIISWNPQERSK